jgi:hypothetical protein
VELQRALLGDPVRRDDVVLGRVAAIDLSQWDVVEVAVDLVGGGEEQRRRTPRAADGFEHVERAGGVDLEVDRR